MRYLVWKAQVNHDDSFENYVTFRKSHEVDFEKLIADLRSQKWDEVEEGIDLDKAVNKWEVLFLDTIDKYMPLKKKRVRKKHSPWLNECIFKLMKDRDKMKSKAKTKKQDVYWKQYKHLRNKVTFEIRRVKKQYFIEKLGACTDRAKSWRVLKTLIPNTKSATNFSRPIDECKRVANDFNEHFVNDGKQFDTSNGNKCISYEEFESTEAIDSTENTFSVPVITQSDVLKEIY